MTTTPSNRLRLTPSNSPFLPRPTRSPIRAVGRSSAEPRLSLRRVVGTTCCSPAGFDTVGSSFAYTAGGAVVVVDVQDDQYSQRFYRARPTAVPVFAVAPVSQAFSTPNSTPKANDSRNRVAAGSRDSLYGSPDPNDSPTPKTWTSRERIKAATCLGLSRDGKYLAVGETGYAPRVLIFSLQDASSDIPLVSISEHAFGVKAVAWSDDSKYLASLGTANDGFLFMWRVDSRTGAAGAFQQNRCIANIKGMIWMGSSLITLGVRHIKIWRVEDEPTISPTKSRFTGDGSFQPTPTQKSLPGRNILLGTMLEATFTCAVALDGQRAVICTDAGDLCILDDTGKQPKLTRVLGLGFPVSCLALRNGSLHIGGKEGQYATLSVEAVLEANSEAVPKSTCLDKAERLAAMGFLTDNLVTIDAKGSINIWNPDAVPSLKSEGQKRIPIPGHGDPITGIQPLPQPNYHGAAFFTWSGTGTVTLWDTEGSIRTSFDIPVEQVDTVGELDLRNQLVVVKASQDGTLFVSGDRLGVLRVLDSSCGESLLVTKAHSSECHDISIFEDKSFLLMASAGRDRTVQLFHRSSAGTLEHFQTLEFAARVVQVLVPCKDKILTCSLDRTAQIHDIITKEGEPDAMAALPSRTISLKASPSSMAVTPDCRCIYVSLLDRSVGHYDLVTGRNVNSFKCTDETGVEPVVLDSLIYSQSTQDELACLLALSNTDKSIRIYNAQTGAFMDREWGHTEAIKGVIMLEDDEVNKVVSVGCDGTIMIWALDPDPAAGSADRDESPEKSSSTSQQRPLRKVLSRAELAEFARPSSSNGRRSPPRVQRRTSRFNLGTALRTPKMNNSKRNDSLAEDHIDSDTPVRRASSRNSSDSPPPVSPKHRLRIFRRPSLPALPSKARTPPSSGANTAMASHKKSSSPDFRSMRDYGFGSVSMATEQTCRQLRAYRKKLNSSEPIAPDLLLELDTELRLTVKALGERSSQVRTRRESEQQSRVREDSAIGESLVNGLLDQYSELLVSKLGEKLGLQLTLEDIQGIKPGRATVSQSLEGVGADGAGDKRLESANESSTSRAISMTLTAVRTDTG